jgi:hypothetical protein
MPSPFKGATGYSVSFSNHGLRTELYIDSTDPEAVEAEYQRLEGNRDEIEDIFGEPLSWEELRGSKASRIATYLPGDITQLDQYDRYLDWLIAASTRLRAALDPYA